MVSKIIQQGAEAIIYLKNNQILKKRIKKSYRIDKIDKKLRNSRTKSEAKIMNKLSKFINVPKILEVDKNKQEILMEYIKGEKLSDNLEKSKYKKICEQIGKILTKMHDQNIIHGDLTTNNMIYIKNKIYLIDFGLSFHSRKIEDKATDLYLLKQSLKARHNKISKKCFSIVLNNYKSKDYIQIISRIKKVESRGRYKKK